MAAVNLAFDTAKPDVTLAVQVSGEYKASDSEEVSIPLCVMVRFTP